MSTASTVARRLKKGAEGAAVVFSGRLILNSAFSGKTARRMAAEQEEVVAAEEEAERMKDTSRRIRETIARISIALPPIFRAIFSTLALSSHCSPSFFYSLHERRSSRLLEHRASFQCPFASANRKVY